MDAKELFFERYDGFQEYPEHLVRGLAEDQLRHSPEPRLNPIAWTLWHLARCEDVGVNRLLTDGTQVFDQDDWAARLGDSRREIGTGMSRERVLELCGAISLSGLEAYGKAVTARTQEVVRALPLDALEEKLERGHLLQVFDAEGTGGDVAESIVDAYLGHTKGWLLGHLVLTHHYYHIGQAFGVRALLGVANPW